MSKPKDAAELPHPPQRHLVTMERAVVVGRRVRDEEPCDGKLPRYLRLAGRFTTSVVKRLMTFSKATLVACICGESLW